MNKRIHLYVPFTNLIAATQVLEDFIAENSKDAKTEKTKKVIEDIEKTVAYFRHCLDPSEGFDTFLAKVHK